MSSRRNPHLACALLPLAILASCRGTCRIPPLTPPVVTLELQNLTAEERAVVEGYLEGAARERWRVEAPATDEGADLRYRIHLRNWAEHEDLHRGLVGLRGPDDGHVILTNHVAQASLAYTSSQAESHSAAVVTIRVVPPEAELHFDTAVPRRLATPAALSADGSFELRLPFQFIRRHDSIYFHSLYKGQYRYYRYHLETEQQELLPGIDSPRAMARFLSGR